MSNIEIHKGLAQFLVLRGNPKYNSRAIFEIDILSLETWKTEEKQKVSPQSRNCFLKKCSRAGQSLQHRRPPARLTVLDFHHEFERKSSQGIRAVGRAGSKCGDKRRWKCQTRLR